MPSPLWRPVRWGSAAHKNGILLHAEDSRVRRGLSDSHVVLDKVRRWTQGSRGLNSNHEPCPATICAFEDLDQFEGRGLLSTWLTKIAVHEAWIVLKQRSRLKAIGSALGQTSELSVTTQTPEHKVLSVETRAMRLLEEMSTLETAHCLNVSQETVKIRLLRARHILRRTLDEKMHAASAGVFQFQGERGIALLRRSWNEQRLRQNGHDAAPRRLARLEV